MSLIFCDFIVHKLFLKVDATRWHLRRTECWETFPKVCREVTHVMSSVYKLEVNVYSVTIFITTVLCVECLHDIS